MLYLLVVLFWINVVLIFSWKYNMSYWKRRGVVQLPIDHLIFGNAKVLALCKKAVYEYSAETYKKLKKLNKHFGGHYLSLYPALFVIHPDLIKQILVVDFKYFQDRGMHCNKEYDPLNCSIINLRGDKWRTTRTKLTPAFTSGKLKQLFSTFDFSAEKLLDVLDERARTGECFDSKDLIFRAVMDNLARVVFGLEANMLTEKNSEFYKFGCHFFDSTLSNMSLLFSGIHTPKLLDIFRIPITNKKVSKFFRKIILDTVSYRQDNGVMSLDFLGLFLKLTGPNENDLSYNDVEAHAFAFFAAGFETSASTVTFCLVELSYNEKIQEKLRDEIMQISAKNNGQITFDNINEMNYLDKVVSETLRKYPTLSFILRKCTETYTIPGTNVVIEKGIPVWISPFAIHNDPEYYPDPVKFDPERFSEEGKSKRHPFTYIPFGEGPRICIGKRFALLQVKVMLTKLLQKYKFQMDPKTKYPIEFSSKGSFLSAKHTLWLKCIKIE